jgi:hypothetical protein
MKQFNSKEFSSISKNVTFVSEEEMLEAITKGSDENIKELVFLPNGYGLIITGE